MPIDQDAPSKQENEAVESTLSPEELARINNAGNVSADAVVKIMTGRTVGDMLDQHDPNIQQEVRFGMTGLSLNLMQMNLETVEKDVDKEGRTALDRFQSTLGELLSDKLTNTAENNTERRQAALASARQFVEHAQSSGDEDYLKSAQRDLDNLQAYVQPNQVRFSVDYNFDDTAQDNAILAEAAWQACDPESDLGENNQVSQRATNVFRALLSLVPEKSNIVIDMNKGSIEYFKSSDPYDNPSQSAQF